LSFGVFQEFYTTHNNIKGSPGAIATVGTTLNGLMYLMMPLTFTLLTRYPRLRPYCGPTGLLITVGSLILSSYAKQVWQLIASQGVLYAIGSGLLFSPTALYLDEWFIARKGMTYGTIWAGKSAAGVAFPFLMSSLLTKYGAKTTLQAWAIALVIITSPLLFFLKPRIPLSNAVSQRPPSWSFLRRSTFWMLQAGNVIQSFGYILPNTYLASYAHTMGLPTITGAVIMTVFSVASVPGGLVHGMLVDRLKPTTVILISSLGSTVAVFALWGLAKHIALLVLFAVAYGFFAGGFSSTYPGILHELKREDEGVDTGLVMGLLLGGRGVGYMASGPASGALLESAWSALEGMGHLGHSTEYGPVIVCTGATALFGGGVGCGRC
jgi:MFS family permease